MIVLILTLLVSIVAAVLVHLDGEHALKAAHQDAEEALERAHKDAQDAIDKSHQDTLAALAKAQASNDIAEQSLMSVQRAFINVDELRKTATKTSDGEVAFSLYPGKFRIQEAPPRSSSNTSPSSHQTYGCISAASRTQTWQSMQRGTLSLRAIPRAQSRLGEAVRT